VLDKILEKGFKKENLILLLGIGVLLFLIAVPTKRENTVTQQPENIVDSKKTEERIQEKLETYLQCMEGVGSVRVYISLQEEQVYGVLVLAQGAGTAGINEKVTRIVMALFGLDANHVQVEKLKK